MIHRVALLSLLVALFGAGSASAQYDLLGDWSWATDTFLLGTKHVETSGPVQSSDGTLDLSISGDVVSGKSGKVCAKLARTDGRVLEQGCSDGVVQIPDNGKYAYVESQISWLSKRGVSEAWVRLAAWDYSCTPACTSNADGSHSGPADVHWSSATYGAAGRLTATWSVPIL